MIDLEQAIRDEFAREASEAPDPEATQRYALSLVAAAPVRRMRQWLLPAVAAVILAVPIAMVIAVRAGSHHSVTASSDPSALYGTSWTLERYVTLDPATGKIISDTVVSTAGAPTLMFTGQTSYRNDGCNTVSGRVTISPKIVDFRPGAGAASGCVSGNPRLNAEIGAMGMVLARSVTWQLTDRVLTISAADGRTLTFIPMTAVTNFRDLYDEDWGLIRWVKADKTAVSYVSRVPGGANDLDPLALQFDGHGGYVLTDCDSDHVSGKAAVTSEHLTMAGVPNRLKCQIAGSTGSGNLPTNVLQEPDLNWQVGNSVLTITAPDGQQLMFYPLPTGQALPSPGR